MSVGEEDSIAELRRELRRVYTRGYPLQGASPTER